MFQELVAFFREVQTFEIVVLCTVGGTWLLLMFFDILFFLRLAFYKVPGSGGSTIPITIIMIERNEGENLGKNLPGWLSMGYPDYEVLVVDDFSEDNSLTTVGLLRLRYPRLKLTGLNQETRYSEKLSRNLGLKAVSSGKVVFVNPDMQTPDNHWLPAIATAFSQQKEIVVGYTRYVPAQGFFHKLFRIESFFQQLESMAFCLNGFPFVATEENISFDKKAYFDINGFAGKIGEEYLNMEMIFNQVIRKKKNSVLVAGNLTLQREKVADKREFQDLLHKSYILKRTIKFNIKAVLWFFNLLKIGYLPLLAGCAFMFPPMWPVLAVLFVFHLIIRMIYLKRVQNRLNETGFFLSSFIYGILIPYIRIFTNWRYHYRRKNS
jgi:glycosyltransferase involved in cell wall biosynthesis